MQNQLIPATISEALSQWDAGCTLFSLEMGELGPGYEMAIQGLAFELMRGFRNGAFGEWGNVEAFAKFEAMVLDPIVTDCDEKPWGGFSGAQVAAAKSLAAYVSRCGYREALHKSDKGRLIHVCKQDLRTIRIKGNA